MFPERLCVERIAGLAFTLALLLSGHAFAEGPQSTPSIFAPTSTPAIEIQNLSLFVLEITGAIFVVVASLLIYVIIRFRARDVDDDREPAQVYGSNQVELAWTVIPVLIVVVLFLTTARLIFGIQDAPRPAAALEVTAVGHQFWWEYRYPSLGIVTANELHIPVSDPAHPTPVYLTLSSAAKATSATGTDLPSSWQYDRPNCSLAMSLRPGSCTQPDSVTSAARSTSAPQLGQERSAALTAPPHHAQAG